MGGLCHGGPRGRYRREGPGQLDMTDRALGSPLFPLVTSTGLGTERCFLRVCQLVTWWINKVSTLVHPFSPRPQMDDCSFWRQ